MPQPVEFKTSHKITYLLAIYISVNERNKTSICLCIYFCGICKVDFFFHNRSTTSSAEAQKCIMKACILYQYFLAAFPAQNFDRWANPPTSVADAEDTEHQEVVFDVLSVESAAVAAATRVLHM